jgi:Methylase involved in ubiquinone/menaquinone biosynthesis
LKQNKITEAYNSSAKAYVEKCFNELDYKPLDRQLLDRFARLTRDKGIVCDIGCGPGEIANYLFIKGCKVTGIDISENMIIEAKKLNTEIEFIVDDMFNLRMTKEHFAGICSFYAIVNFQYDEIKRIFKEYYRVLKNNGLLLIAFHIEEKEIHVVDFFGSGMPLDFFYFNENIVLEMLKEAGFNIIEALVRFPYEQEYPTKRAYILGEKI